MQSRSKLGVCSWSLQASSPADLCGKVAQTGLSACQLALDPLLEGQWGEIETINTLHAAGVEILSGMIGFKGEDYSTLETIKHTGGVRLDAHWEYNRNHAKHAAAMAQRLGLKLVTFHAGFIPHEACRERTLMIERLREVCDRFDDRGVRVGFETGQESAHTLLDALNELKRPQVGVNFDPANMILYAMGDPIAALRELSPRVVQVHIKDALKTTTPGQWGSEVASGTGQVDWKAFFGVLSERGLSVNRLIEREAGESRVADIRTAAALVGRLG
jgi:L-ribulose-5-phosphate 3-epimerase